MKFISNYIVFSSPSGGGKSTIVNILIKKYKELTESMSATTRQPRHNEINGKDYYFFSKEQFHSFMFNNQFLEYEKVHDNYYGTPKESVDSLINQGKTVLFILDVNGAQSIKNVYPETILIFIKPPNKQELIRRLKARGSETEKTMKKRLQRLNYEYSQAKKFDYIVINDQLNETIKEIENILLGDK